MTATDGFQPRILGFLCNWCSYAGADLAGVSRHQYPTAIRIIRVMCSGRVDPVFVLRAFSRGVDGVMMLGCHPGDCHYAIGNYYARNRVKALRQLLELAEISPNRLLLDWISAGEGERFATLVRDFTEQIIALGPLNRRGGLPGDELQERLAAARRVMESEQIRWLVGRELEMADKGDVYGHPIDQETFEALLKSSVQSEYLRARLLLMAADRPQSVKEMASEMGVTPQSVLSHVVALEQAGLMTMVGIEGSSPTYHSIAD